MDADRLSHPARPLDSAQAAIKLAAAALVRARRVLQEKQEFADRAALWSRAAGTRAQHLQERMATVTSPARRAFPGHHG
jgi:hypothetical protein